MSDEQIIHALIKFKTHCASIGCQECKFSISETECQIQEIIHLLRPLPWDWDIDALIEVIKK